MNNKKSNNVLVGVLCALECELLFGISFIFTKIGIEASSPFALLGWRFLIAFIIMSILILTGAIHINLKGKNIKTLAIISIFSPCTYFIGETIGISHTTASESGVFLACIPVVAVTASTFYLRKKPSKFQFIGILITLVGVVITVLAASVGTSLSIKGYLFLLISVLSYAIYSVLVEEASEFSGIEITYIMLVAGALVFGAIAIIEAIKSGSLVELSTLPFKNKGFAVAILYQSIGCSILAFFLSNIAISKIGVNKASSFIGICTVVSVVSGTIVLKERFTIYQIIGAAIIILGVYIANMNIKSKTMERLTNVE